MCTVSCLSTLQIDLIPMINKAGCECLNESDDHPFTQALSSSGGFLESDTDEQVMEDRRQVGCVVQVNRWG